MTTPKRCSVLSFVFTCLCITKPLLLVVNRARNFFLVFRTVSRVEMCGIIIIIIIIIIIMITTYIAFIQFCSKRFTK